MALTVDQDHSACDNGGQEQGQAVKPEGPVHGPEQKLDEPAMVDPRLTGDGVREGIGAQHLPAFPHQLASFQMPPGVGVGRLADGHGKDGHKENSDHEPLGR